MPTDFAPQGQLSATSFITLARAIHQQKLSGHLTLTQGPVKKIIQFAQGEVSGTASNLPQDSILGVLLATGHLTSAQADEIRTRTAAGKPLGEALMESGKLSRELLIGMKTEQVNRIIGSLCEWEQGEYQFAAGDQADAAQAMPLPDLLLNGVRQLQDSGRLWRLLGGEETQIQLAPGAMERCAQFSLLPHEGYLLTRLDAPMTLGDLMMVSGLPETVTLGSIYALECAELVECRRPAQSAASAAAAQPAAAPVRSPPQVIAPPPASAPAPAAAAAAPAPADSEAGVPAPIPLKVKPPSAAEATTEEIIQMARLVAESDDDHEILGLSPGASKAAVKSSYTKLAKKYHPDRYHKNSDEATHTALKDIFARVRRAYEKLREIAPEESATPPPEANTPASTAPPFTPPVAREESRAATGREEPFTRVRTESPFAGAKEQPVVEHFDHGGTAATYNVRPMAVESNSVPDHSSVTAASVPAQRPTPQMNAGTAAQSEAHDHPVIEIAGDAFQPADYSAFEADEAEPAVLNQEEAALQTAELNFHHAVGRYQSGDMMGALELMTTAVQLAPDNALYHDQLATLLAINPRRRKEAETHLLRAIELEPQNPEWHINLASLYKALGIPARAESQLKKVLSFDPDNSLAKKELRGLQSAKHKSGEGDKAESRGGAEAKKADAARSSVSGFLARAKETSVSDLFSKFMKRK